jgi:hypothetical protein
VELRVIYDSLSVQSPIQTDQAEFLTWCKQCCAETTILDLNEMGEYFTELMQQQQLDVATLPVVGFEFLQNYFLSVNENQSKLLRVQSQKKKSTKQTTAGVTWSSYYVTSLASPAPNQEESDDDDQPEFNVVIDPRQLEKLDLIRIVVKQCQNPVVVKKAVDFLIRIYTCLDESLNDKRGEIAQLLIDDCVQSLNAPDVKTHEIKRLLQILRSLIEVSEKHGMSDVQPHSAILKGETLDRIIIKNTTRPYFPNLVVKVYSSATLWEFVNKVSRMCDLAP